VNYTVCVSVYNTTGVLTGRSVTVTFPSKTAGDINVPGFDPNNACPRHDSTVDTTTPIALPGAVTLTAPADNVTGVNLTPALLWTPGPGGTPSKYFVKVSTSHSFSTNVVNDTSASTSDIVGTALSYQTRYYWEVAANNTAGTGAYTIDSFTTIAAPVYPPCTYPADPHTPMMLNKDSSTVALWNFNQLSGSTVPDESGTGNNGSMFGTTQLITADWGTGIQLATGCGVKVFDATSLRLSNFEITAHVYPTQFGSYNNIVAKEPPGGGAPGGYILRFDSNGYISGYIKYWDWVGVHTQCPVQLNTWYLIRLVKTATTLSLYVNNLLVSSISTTIDPSVEVGDLAIGYDVNLVEDRTFRGYIDAIKINKL
jgi:hypothetical protein